MKFTNCTMRFHFMSVVAPQITVPLHSLNKTSGTEAEVK